MNVIWRPERLRRPGGQTGAIAGPCTFLVRIVSCQLRSPRQTSIPDHRPPSAQSPAPTDHHGTAANVRLRSHMPWPFLSCQLPTITCSYIVSYSLTVHHQPPGQAWAPRPVLHEFNLVLLVMREGPDHSAYPVSGCGRCQSGESLLTQTVSILQRALARPDFVVRMCPRRSTACPNVLPPVSVLPRWP